MKKIMALLLIAALLCALTPVLAEQAQPRLRVVTTIFHIYYWTRQIVGDTGGVELTLLLDSGVDLHSFQPTAQDIMRIATCDLFVYVGGESDEWVEDALKEAVNPKLQALSLLEALGDRVKEEELVEGMEAEEEEEGDEEETEYDEHVWLSLRNAKVLCGVIADALCAADPGHAEAYRANLAAYDQQLQDLDERYSAAVAGAALKTVLFGDRFPFRYLADDYGLIYYAAFAGCSAETEASFRTIAFLAAKADELGLPAVLTIEGANHRIAETVVQASQDAARPVLVMDSMQGTTMNDVNDGVTYLSVMENNLRVLTEALN